MKIGLYDISGLLHYIRTSKDDNKLFGKSILKEFTFLKNKLNLDMVIPIQDFGQSSYRKEIYPEYKEGDRGKQKAKKKTKKEEEKFQEMRLWNKNLSLFSDYFPVVKVWQVEADDLIGIIGTRLKQEGYDVVAITADKDIITTNLPVYNWQKDKMMTLDDTHGLTSKKFLALQALMGDNIDNIKGVCGIKTALLLLEKFKKIKTMREVDTELLLPENKLEFSERYPEIPTRNRHYVMKALRDIQSEEGYNKLKLNRNLVNIMKDTSSLTPKQEAQTEEAYQSILDWQAPTEFLPSDDLEEFLMEHEPSCIKDLQDYFNYSL